MSPFRSIIFYLIYFETLRLSAYTFWIVTSSWRTDPSIVMSCPSSLMIVMSCPSSLVIFLVLKSTLCKVEIVWGKWRNIQNRMPSLGLFTYPEPPVESREGVERKQPFSPPLYSWHVIALASASHQGTALGVSLGWRSGSVRACRGQRERSEPCLASVYSLLASCEQ